MTSLVIDPLWPRVTKMVQSDSAGKVEIEIRDLDQTVIGNQAHDLIRLALSLSMAARSSDLRV
jgi:uncharacterized protein (DUF2252 family)